MKPARARQRRQGAVGEGGPHLSTQRTHVTLEVLCQTRKQRNGVVAGEECRGPGRVFWMWES